MVVPHNHIVRVSADAVMGLVEANDIEKRNGGHDAMVQDVQEELWRHHQEVARSLAELCLPSVWRVLVVKLLYPGDCLLLHEMSSRMSTRNPVTLLFPMTQYPCPHRQ